VADNERAHPTLDDPVVGALSESVGGPLGARATRHPWWTPLRVILALTAITFALGMVQKSTCYATSWQDGDLRYVHMCYSDLPYLYTGRGFAELNWPYDDDAQVRQRYAVMEYPVGISYWAWGTAWVTHWVSGSPDLSPRYEQPADSLGGQPAIVKEMKTFVVVNAIGFALLALITSAFLVRVNPGRPWDAAGFALAPPLALTGLINWDMVAVVLVAGALWAWARGRPVLTGVFIGLGTAAKLYPLFLLGGILVICWRRRQWGAFALTTLVSGLAWAVANAPAVVSFGGPAGLRFHPAQWEVFWTFNSERGADLGSIWLVIDQAFDLGITAHTINLGSWAFFVAWCAGVLILGLGAPRTPRLAQLGFLIVAGFLLVNKVYSPQYVLWLLPLAALARPRWRDLIVWFAGEMFYFASVWWYLGGILEPAGGGDVGFYWLAIAVRMLAELYLVAVVVRDLRRPWHDPVASDDGSAGDDAVERGRGESDADLDLVADGRDPGALGEEEHRSLHVGRLSEQP
jgi:uncharacterized membrane protein